MSAVSDYDLENALKAVDDLFATLDGYEKYVVLQATTEVTMDELTEYRREIEADMGAISLKLGAPQWEADLMPRDPSQMSAQQAQLQTQFFMDRTLTKAPYVIFQPTCRDDVSWKGRDLLGTDLTLSKVVGEDPTEEYHSLIDGEDRPISTYTLGPISVEGTWMVAERKQGDDGNFYFEPCMEEGDVKGAAEFNLNLIVADQEAFQKALQAEKESSS
jgi:hypothetical protein